MSRFAVRLSVSGLLILAVFVGLIYFVGPRANADSRAATAIIREFYTRCRAKDYASARELMTANLKGTLSTTQLQGAWARFVAKDGAFEDWRPEINGTFIGNRVSVFPRSVQATHMLHGAKGNTANGFASIKLVVENGQWRIDSFSLAP